MSFKNLIRNALNYLHLDLTKNLRYDRLTKAVIKRAVKPGYNCIDIGCHKGEIMEIILKQSPQGQHYGFEPIPVFYKELEKKFTNLPNCTIYPYALSNSEGTTTFQFVKNAPAFSGIKKRQYLVEKPDIEEIQVELKQLDKIIPQNLPVNFIKIDVEGAEYLVLKGAQNILNRHKPVVIFEFGLGASDYYGTKPQDVYELFSQAGMGIFLLHHWLKNKPALSKEAFINHYNTTSEYYFVADKMSEL